MDILQTKGNQIVTPDGQPIQLRSTGVGGWMNMENFIDGYPARNMLCARSCARC